MLNVKAQCKSGELKVGALRDKKNQDKEFLFILIALLCSE